MGPTDPRESWPPAQREPETPVEQGVVPSMRPLVDLSLSDVSTFLSLLELMLNLPELGQLQLVNKILESGTILLIFLRLNIPGFLDGVVHLTLDLDQSCPQLFNFSHHQTVPTVHHGSLLLQVFLCSNSIIKMQLGILIFLKGCLDLRLLSLHLLLGLLQLMDVLSSFTNLFSQLLLDTLEVVNLLSQLCNTVSLLLTQSSSSGFMLQGGLLKVTTQLLELSLALLVHLNLSRSGSTSLLKPLTDLFKFSGEVIKGLLGSRQVASEALGNMHSSSRMEKMPIGFGEKRTNMWWLKNCCSFSLVKLMHNCSILLY
ncbi:hypothetical protein CRUP_029301 [Coryphaenoides rupestris]|nr:hypothetical protein CRUP_029301 [Coryphaenoides rupestris]